MEARTKQTWPKTADLVNPLVPRVLFGPCCPIYLARIHAQSDWTFSQAVAKAVQLTNTAKAALDSSRQRTGGDTDALIFALADARSRSVEQSGHCVSISKSIVVGSSASASHRAADLAPGTPSAFIAG